MTTPMFVADCEALCAQGCSNPACHVPHPAEFMWTSRCHPASGMFVDVEPTGEAGAYGALLRMQCGTCVSGMSAIALVAPFKIGAICGHGRIRDVEYKRGRLTVSCRRCHMPLGRGVVAHG